MTRLLSLLLWLYWSIWHSSWCMVHGVRLRHKHAMPTKTVLELCPRMNGLHQTITFILSIIWSTMVCWCQAASWSKKATRTRMTRWAQEQQQLQLQLPLLLNFSGTLLIVDPFTSSNSSTSWKSSSLQQWINLRMRDLLIFLRWKFNQYHHIRRNLPIIIHHITSCVLWVVV